MNQKKKNTENEKNQEQIQGRGKLKAYEFSMLNWQGWENAIFSQADPKKQAHFFVAKIL